jgi:hypothetical protein
MNALWIALKETNSVIALLAKQSPNALTAGFYPWILLS